MSKNNTMTNMYRTILLVLPALLLLAACADDVATPPAAEPADTLVGQPVRFTATGLTVTPAGVTQTKADLDFSTITVYMTDTEGNTWQADYTYNETNSTWEADGTPLYWPTSTGQYTFTAISPAGTDPHITLPTEWTETNLKEYEAIRATYEAEPTKPTEEAISLTLRPALTKVQVVSISGQPVSLIDAPAAGTLDLAGSVSATTGLMTLYSPDNIVSEGYVLPAGEGFGFLSNNVYKVEQKLVAGNILTICDDEEVEIINCAEAGKLTWPTGNPAKVLITGTINDDDMDEIEKHKDEITHLYVTASINKGGLAEGLWFEDMSGDSDNPSPLQVVCLTQAKEIGDGAFSSSNLKTVSLPEATDIGSNAFASCAGLETVSLPKATNIQSSAFQNSDKLTSICLPKNIQISNPGSFLGLSSLLTTLFLSNCTKDEFKEEDYKNYGSHSWTTIHYGYKGTGDYLDENNYTGHWTQTNTPSL